MHFLAMPQCIVLFVELFLIPLPTRFFNHFQCICFLGPIMSPYEHGLDIISWCTGTIPCPVGYFASVSVIPSCWPGPIHKLNLVAAFVSRLSPTKFKLSVCSKDNTSTSAMHGRPLNGFLRVERASLHPHCRLTVCPSRSFNTTYPNMNEYLRELSLTS